MKTFVVLLTFTDQGVRDLQQSPPRATAWRQAVEEQGIKVSCQLWTVGSYDGLIVLQGESEEKLLHAISQLASNGNVRTQTLPAFDAEAFAAIVGA